MAGITTIIGPVLEHLAKWSPRAMHTTEIGNALGLKSHQVQQSIQWYMKSHPDEILVKPWAGRKHYYVPSGNGEPEVLEETKSMYLRIGRTDIGETIVKSADGQVFKLVPL